MMTNIDTLIFDLGGVLIDLKKENCIRAFKALGYDKIEATLSEYAQEGAFGDLEAGKITPAQFHDAVRQEIGKEVSDAQIDDAFIQFLVGIPPYKLEMIRELKKRYRVLMLSNISVILFQYIEEHFFIGQGFQLSECFDELYLSYQMGGCKPEAAIYEQLIERSKIDPTRTLYVEDSQANIDACKPFGFKTLLVAPCEDFRPKFGF